MEVRLMSNSYNYPSVTFNLTHVKVHEVVPSSIKLVFVEVLPKLVCQGWRLFHLLLSSSNLLTLTDDHNTIWIDKEFNWNILKLEIYVDNYKSSCITRESLAADNLSGRVGLIQMNLPNLETSGPKACQIT